MSVWFLKTLLPTVCWGSGSVNWLCPLNPNDRHSAPEETLPSKPAQMKPLRQSTCRLPPMNIHLGYHRCRFLPPVPWMSNPWAGINVSCLCPGDGLLSSLALKLWVGGDRFPGLRCHGSPNLGEGACVKPRLAWLTAEVPLAFTSCEWALSVPLQCLPGAGPVQGVRPSKDV